MTDQIPHPMSPQDCLVAIMVAVSASDETIRTAELVKIETAVNMLPVFSGYDIDRTRRVSQIVFDLFEQEDGLDALFGLIRVNLPERLNETAYAPIALSMLVAACVIFGSSYARHPGVLGPLAGWWRGDPYRR